MTHLWHEGPLEARGEARAAAPPQPALLHLIHNPVGALAHNFLGAVPVPTLLGALQVRGRRTASKEVRGGGQAAAAVWCRRSPDTGGCRWAPLRLRCDAVRPSLLLRCSSCCCSLAATRPRTA